jgi:probable F420-dependent oxidoreductase
MAPRIRFSLSVVPFVDPSDRVPYRRTFALCERAEALGFDTVMVGHHHVMAGQISDPFTLLAAVAARTERLRIATAVFLLPLHHPLHVAERVATLDQLSGGRVSLGVGSGWNPLEYAAFGASLRERGSRMDESLTLLRRLWTETDVASDGRFWVFPPVTLAPRPVQQPHPPLWVAGNAPAALDRAARLGTHWLCDPVQTTDSVVERRDEWLAACARHDREPAWVLRRYVWLGRDRAALERDFLPGFVGGQLAYWRESTEAPTERALFARIDAGERVSDAEIARDRFCGGSPDDVVADLAELHERTACTHVSVGFGGGLSGRAGAATSDDVYRSTLDMLERFGNEVLPAFA